MTPDRNPPDETLVARSLAGDPAAFGELVSRYQGYVAAVATRAGVPGSDLDDAVNGVFLKVWRHLRQYRPGSPFATWLYRITVNHAFDEFRRLRRERCHAELPDEVADRQPGSAERLEAAEQSALVREALARLEPLYRETLFLVYVDGLSVGEAALALGLAEGTIKARLHRGRQRLAAMLRREHPEHFGG